MIWIKKTLITHFKTFIGHLSDIFLVPFYVPGIFKVPKHLRPRPKGKPMEFKGYTRVAVRKWIKDPCGQFRVPDHLQFSTRSEYKKEKERSKIHSSAAEKNPSRPSWLEKDFYEPEIFTVRRTDDRPYLKRSTDMVEPTRCGEGQPPSKKLAPVLQAADNGLDKEWLTKIYFYAYVYIC